MKRSRCRIIFNGNVLSSFIVRSVIIHICYCIHFVAGRFPPNFECHMFFTFFTYLNCKFSFYPWNLNVYNTITCACQAICSKYYRRENGKKRYFPFECSERAHLLAFWQNRFECGTNECFHKKNYYNFKVYISATWKRKLKYGRLTFVQNTWHSRHS